jgi:hypothetical protein
MPLMTPTIELATVCSANGNSANGDGVVEDAEDEELPVEPGVGRQFLAGGEEHQPADRGADGNTAGGHPERADLADQDGVEQE